ncbi:hypothetical protein [Azospirillum argentinense]|uniref:hypothetical protein n=1 Tax=Azospirillum argentinense TaxID=2970906 RepID=UPI0032DFA889
MEAAPAIIDDLQRFAYEFGIRLEAARMTIELTPGEMCKLLGCARSTYTSYIRGDSMIAAHRLAPLVARGISCDYLLFGTTLAPNPETEAKLKANEAAARVDRETPTNKGRRDL